MTAPITHAIDGPIATVVLDNPGKLNAMSLEGWAELGRVMGELAENASLRCVVIRGAGGKAFCSGADITEFPDVRANAEQARDYGDIVSVMLKNISGCIHPTVAAIQGVCTGGGLEVACACDIRICNASSRFGVPINRLGHAFAYPEMETVLAAAGRRLILEMILEGRILESEEALSRGLINRVVADADFEDEIQATTGRIVDGAPLTNRATKKFLNRLLDPTPLTREELDEAYDLCDTEDYAEGLRAFLAKEKPAFEGK